jgi:lysyl endopeptidase
LIRGWVCQANAVEVQIDDGERQKVAYGTTRNDTIGVCGDANNGFGYTFNWNTLSNGSHIVRAFADGAEFTNVAFIVTTLGVEYLQGVSGEYTLPNFPQVGRNVTVRWAEPHQNFVITQAQ